MEHKREHSIDWDLIAKDIAGELTPEEHERLSHELSGDKDLLGQLSTLWGDAKYAQEVKSIDTDKAWTKVHGKIGDTNVSQHRGISLTLKRTMLVAATLIIALVSYMLIKNSMPVNPFEQITAQNELLKVNLHDGSVVDLNVGSTLEYPKEFENSVRNVKLTGEAFFEIARNEKQPFIIETNNLKIKVLGTSFNVKSNFDDGDEVVTVSTGKVQVWHNEKYLILEKDEAADFDAATNSLVKVNTVDVNYKAWKTKEIAFDNVPLREVFSIIETVYHVRINVDSSVKQDSLILNADFSHDDLNHVLGSVCGTFNLTYTAKEGKYRIEPLQ